MRGAPRGGGLRRGVAVWNKQEHSRNLCAHYGSISLSAVRVLQVLMPQHLTLAHHSLKQMLHNSHAHRVTWQCAGPGPTATNTRTCARHPGRHTLRNGPMSMHVHAHTRPHTCVHRHTHTHAHIGAHTCALTQKDAHTHVYTHTTKKQWPYARMHAHTHRAMATRCFSPPLSFSPRSPTSVSYPSGMAMMVSWM